MELDFPAPDLPDDPDVIVIGSENGLGKTSVLECCALSLRFGKGNESHPKVRVMTELVDLLVRAGQPRTLIESIYADDRTVSLMISEKVAQSEGADFAPTPLNNGDLIITYDGGDAVAIETSKTPPGLDFISKICGFSPNPIIEDNLLFFHSYRKVAEGNLRFGTLLNGKHSSNGNNTEPLASIFKRTALFSMMSSADLFDSPKDPDVHRTLEKLNYLLGLYAGCRFAKLRQTENDSLELRVQPVGVSETFNFDGLSSGQKEIITTLFLIWYETRNQSKIVLIDEPELHLNSQWHRSFVNSLVELAPKNQYIIATHSATVMDSVDRNRRILLQKDKEGGQ